ncbi:MAG: hypothetical protein ACPGO5_01860 [Patescibacteria group bacterium]
MTRPTSSTPSSAVSLGLLRPEAFLGQQYQIPDSVRAAQYQVLATWKTPLKSQLDLGWSGTFTGASETAIERSFERWLMQLSSKPEHRLVQNLIMNDPDKIMFFATGLVNKVSYQNGEPSDGRQGSFLGFRRKNVGAAIVERHLGDHILVLNGGWKFHQDRTGIQWFAVVKPPVKNKQKRIEPVQPSERVVRTETVTRDSVWVFTETERHVWTPSPVHVGMQLVIDDWKINTTLPKNYQQFFLRLFQKDTLFSYPIRLDGRAILENSKIEDYDDVVSQEYSLAGVSVDAEVDLPLFTLAGGGQFHYNREVAVPDNYEVYGSAIARLGFVRAGIHGSTQWGKATGDYRVADSTRAQRMWVTAGLFHQFDDLSVDLGWQQSLGFKYSDSFYEVHHDPDWIGGYLHLKYLEFAWIKASVEMYHETEVDLRRRTLVDPPVWRTKIMAGMAIPLNVFGLFK